MAGDWFPLQLWRSRCPEVVRIASATGRTRHEVLGLVCDFWSWASTESADGKIDGVTLDNLPELIGADAKFWSAVAAVGWLDVTGDGGGIVVPGWETWFSASAKTRAKDAQRKRRERSEPRPKSVREVSAKCPKSVRETSDKSHAREEKRREEIREEPPTPFQGAGLETKSTAAVAVKTDPVPLIPIPANLDTADFRAAWAEWIAARKARRKPLTERAARLQLSDLAAKLDAAGAVACIRDSIRNDWQGLFPDKHTPGAGRGPNLFDRGAATESRVLAQCREALADC